MYTVTFFILNMEGWGWGFLDDSPVDSKKKTTKPATIRATQEPEPKPTFQEEEEEEEMSNENDVHPKEEDQDRVWSNINEL